MIRLKVLTQVYCPLMEVLTQPKGQVIVEDYAAPATIHFYKGPNIILKYVGNNSKIISSLEMLYGNQFAGS